LFFGFFLQRRALHLRIFLPPLLIVFHISAKHYLFAVADHDLL
jgi:hypothetical protein